ncbi:Flp family type IVb pilin [Rhizobium skierniewicense]|uniref:Flp family type IVb pilin n=1 Tax=Rhizobium TaxID=379 RepID=UPI001FAC31C8|nr:MULTISPECIES: Flp family type IVb pilin [Rhizobium]MCI9866676.1 Flp family type IVb pilin [Rhizobium skierniewicense]
MTQIFARFMKDESGATAIEYGLIAALISVGIITGASTIGSSLSRVFGDISTKISGSGAGGAAAPAK